MGHIEIRKVTLDDIAHLQKIGRLTFQKTFSASNSEENRRKNLEEGFFGEKLTGELNDE